MSKKIKYHKISWQTHAFPIKNNHKLVAKKTRVQFSTQEICTLNTGMPTCCVAGCWRCQTASCYSPFASSDLPNPAAIQKKNQRVPPTARNKNSFKHAMSEVCLLPRSRYSRGRVCKAQSQHTHTHTFWKTVFPKAFAILSSIFPKLVRRVFPKELLSASLFIHLPNIHHPHLICPLHHLHLLYNLLRHLL